MRIVAVDYRTLRWPIAPRGAARGGAAPGSGWSERTAATIAVHTDAGATGLGEAAPLPGMSIDQLDDALHAFDALAARLPLTIEVPAHATAIADRITPAPAARFAIETALLAALAQHTRTSIAALLAPVPQAELRSAVVVDTVDEALTAVALGAPRLKLKTPTPAHLAFVRQIATAVPGTRLRIDANRGWPREQARALLASLADLPIDYVEEPCADAHELLARHQPVRLALDESLIELTQAQLGHALESAQLAALVLKPTLLGGFARCLELAAAAHAHGIAPVVTHTLEGPVGFAACRELARAIGADVPAGLARHSALAGFWAHLAGRAPDVRTGPAARNRESDTSARTTFGGHSSSATPGNDRESDTSHRAVFATASVSAATADPEQQGPIAAGCASDVRMQGPIAGHEDVIAGHIALASADWTAVVAGGRAWTVRDCMRAAAPEEIVAHVGATHVDTTEGHRPSSVHLGATHVGTTAAARCVVATPTVETIGALYRALSERHPIAVLHARATETERARQRDLLADAELRDGDAVVLFTSGSTGPSRGVVHTRASIAAAAEASASHLGWRDDDRWLCCLPLAHASGLSIVVRCLLAKRPVVLGDVELLGDPSSGVTLASLVPAQLAQLLDDPAWRPAAQLRAVLLGGAAAPPALIEAAIARRVPVLPTYGLTETFGQVATARVPGGRPVVLDSVTIDAGTREAPERIGIRGGMLASRYLDGAPIAPALATADLGFVEAEGGDTAGRGELHVLGRIDDVIISGGENVHPTQVEAVLAATPGVRAAAAFGVPDVTWGQIVGAAICVATGFDRDGAIVRWRAQLPPHARPRRLAIVDELPRLPSGKLDRRSLGGLAGVSIEYVAPHAERGSERSRVL